MVGLLLSFVCAASGAFADSVTVKQRDGDVQIKIESESEGLGFELFQSLKEYSSGYYDTDKDTYEGIGFKAVVWIKYDDDINGQAYIIQFVIDPYSQKLKMSDNGKKISLYFEGLQADYLFQGLYKRRLGNEEYYEMGKTGNYVGDYYIRTSHLYGELECKHAHRERADKLVEGYAACTLTTKGD